MTGPLTPPSGTADADPLVPVEEVARRLGVSLGVLLQRVEAGDVAAHRETGPDGVRYSIRLSDLGVESDLEPSPLRDHEASDTTGSPGPADDGPPLASELEFEPVDRAVPPPSPSSAAPTLTLFDGYGDAGPRREVAAMSLDAREIVGGLLDRWERTLEQRIYAEQRQRFEGELLARQNLAKQLQMELQAVRIEHAAVQAEQERHLAEKGRALADRERELAENQRQIDELRTALPKKRGWLFRR